MHYRLVLGGYVLLMIWEYLVNLIELILFVFFIHSKLHIKSTSKYRTTFIFIYLIIEFILISLMNKMNLSSSMTMLFSCILDIIFAYLFFQDNGVLRFFWGFSFSILCLIAEFITVIGLLAFSENAIDITLLKSNLRIPCQLLYLTIITALILLLNNTAKKEVAFTAFQKISYVLINISGIAISQYVLYISLEFDKKFSDSSFSARLALMDIFFIFLFLVLLIYIYQLGSSKKENLRLLEEQKEYELERLEFNNLVKTTEQLREIKHDMQIYLDTIHLMAKEGNINDLISYTEQYQKDLSVSQTIVSTGNTAIDCILSTKLNSAKKLGIKTDYSVMIPKAFPLESVELSSVLGNLWNNAIEACTRLMSENPSQQAFINFYIKPYQNMVLLHIENNFNGALQTDGNNNYLSIKSESGHGFGLKRIREIIDNADGLMQITTDNNIFSLHIIIPEKEPTI